jgi:hypothetical protein
MLLVVLKTLNSLCVHIKGAINPLFAMVIARFGDYNRPVLMHLDKIFSWLIASSWLGAES